MKGFVLVCVAAALWGTVGVANRLMMARPPLDPALVGLTRTALGAFCLLAVAAAIGVPWPGRRRLPLRLLLVFGLAGAVFQTCLFAAFDAVGVTVTVAVTVAGPATLVAIGDAAWNHRRPDVGASAAIALATLGVLVAVAGGHRPAGPPLVAWSGAGLLVAAVAGFAMVAATARALGRFVHPLHGAGLGLLATTVALLVATLLRQGGGIGAFAAMAPLDLGILAYTGVVATGGAYLAFLLGMQFSRSPTVGIAPTLIEPGVAALLAALVLHERLRPLEAAGCALLLAAMVMLALVEWRGFAAAPPASDPVVTPPPAS